jgi:hypothetical protein
VTSFCEKGRAKDRGVSDAAPVITLPVGDYDAVLFQFKS